MVLAGQLGVSLSQNQCKASARWLTDWQPGALSLIGNSEFQLSGRDKSAILAAKFAKCGRRKSLTCAERRLPRELLSWFGQLLDACMIRAHLAGCALPPPMVMETMRICRNASSSKLGRPRKERSEAELARWHFADDNEHYRRQLRRRAIYDGQWAEWTARLAARGETLITSSEPPPKI